MILEFDLALRFLRRRVGVLLRGTALAAFFGIALATMALVVTLALMNGYSGAIARALQQGNAHLVGFSPVRMSGPQSADLARRLATDPGVRRASPVTYLAALAEDPTDPARPLPVVLKAVAEPPPYAGFAEWPEGPPVAAVIGDGLGRSLGLGPGSTLTLRFPPSPGSWISPALPVKIAGTFSLAFTEFDNRWVVAPLAEITRALPGTDVAGIEIVLVDPLAVEEARRAMSLEAPDLVFTDWREMNRPLFAALRWQTLSLFVVLSLVVAVASFQLSSALVVLTIDKRRTSGMLQALGATPARVWRILALAGLILGGAGVAAGLTLGSLACCVLTVTRAVRFPEHLARVYLVDHVPFVVSIANLTAVAVVCAVLVCIAAAWPAWKSARRDPAELLRAV